MDRHQPSTREFSENAYRVGDLKRRLGTVVLAYLTQDGAGTLAPAGTHVIRRVVKNINKGLSLHVSVGLANNGTGALIEAVSLPAGAITWQGIPVNIFGDSPPVPLRPIFQDPTFSDNSNHPLPQDVPFGWEFSTVGDDLIVDTTINTSLLVNTLLTAQLVLQVAVEYSGAWPFPEAVKFMLNQVQITGGGTTLRFDTRPIG